MVQDVDPGKGGIGPVPSRYGKVAALLHWTIAILIIVNVLIGWDFPDPLPGQRFSPKPLLPLHVSLGLLVMILSIVRLGWRLSHRAPPMPGSMPRWERRAAHLAHLAFYGLMIGMPFTGWLVLSAHKVHKNSLSVFSVIPWPHFPGFTILPEDLVHTLHDLAVDVHALLSLWLFPAMLALHIGAVVKHHLVDKDPVLLRMMPRWIGKGRLS